MVAAAAMRGVTAEAAAPAAGSAPAGARGVAPAAASSAGGTSGAHAAPSGRWDAFKLSPASRTVAPVAVHATTGGVGAAGDLVRKPGTAATRLSGEGASVTLDFGKEVGGHVTLTLGAGTDADQLLGLTYSELSTYVSTTSSDGSNGGSNDEPPVCYTAQPAGRISTRTSVPVSGTDAADDPASQLRGGFRYLTVVNQGAGAVELAGVTVEIAFAPNTADLRAYPNYFSCDDDLLTRIWYAGAYTVQTNIVANNQGRVWGPPAVGWNNGARIGEAGDTVLVDGAKRDRTVWPGDLGISVLTDYVSLGDMRTVRDSLQTLYNHQAGNGALPYAGPAVDFIGNSDTYHLWTLIGTASYLQFTGDTAWATGIYPRYKAALDYVTAKIDGDGLLDVTASADWARTDSDGKNIEANAIMYRALVTAGPLARAAGDTATASDSTARAAALKSAVEAAGYWDGGAGLYRDKPGSTLYPQDGNALAVWFGLVPDADRAAAVSKALGARWTPVGALTPEKSAQSVHPFPGGMEVHAHFAAGRDSTALDLVRREWGYMLDAPQGTASTFWEGYRTDGSSDYTGSYMSAAHGWSTGPTSALTFRLLGIAPADDGTAGYRVAPHPGGVGRAEGQLTTPAGVIAVSWRDRGRGEFDLTVTAASGAVGEIAVPVAATGSFVVKVDGKTAWDRTARAYSARAQAGYVVLTGVPAGTRTVTVRRG
ncbi:putative alpha-L-rhamnosidase [Actinacidiphila reveromycinica]|uniref:Putative alpha-L-rhamnosidase n=1 Tax=Actinacidiphila reveromycinica TaxID=659352 RepID=A0A7U3VMJ0_9ACTN|nr:putative alpha-L-rhamnosidase [Streptomyces sp. SN-593]